MSNNSPTGEAGYGNPQLTAGAKASEPIYPPVCKACGNLFSACACAKPKQKVQCRLCSCEGVDGTVLCREHLDGFKYCCGLMPSKRGAMMLAAIKATGLAMRQQGKGLYTVFGCIAEWRKCCSIAGPRMVETDDDFELWREHPAMCTDCTEGLIDAIEQKLTKSWLRRLISRWL